MAAANRLRVELARGVLVAPSVASLAFCATSVAGTTASAIAQVSPIIHARDTARSITITAPRQIVLSSPSQLTVNIRSANIVAARQQCRPTSCIYHINGIYGITGMRCFVPAVALRARKSARVSERPRALCWRSRAPGRRWSHRQPPRWRRPQDCGPSRRGPHLRATRRPTSCRRTRRKKA